MDEPSSLYLSNSSSGPITLRELDPDPVARNEADEMSTEAVGDVSKDPDPILELYPEHSIGKDLEDPTCSQIGWLGHERLLYPNRIGFNPCRARSA
jgi:hypothetical protein